jgi:hypothetical protein
MGTGTVTVSGVNRVVRNYTVRWMTYDGGTTLETDYSVPYGTKASFEGTNPTRPSTAQYHYRFDG